MRELKSPLEKLACAGALIAAAACPAYESQLFIAAQALVVVAVLGHGLSYLRHRNGWLVGAALASGAAIFAGLYWAGSEALIYLGFAGLIGASATEFWNRRRRRAMPILDSIITCPQCGVRRTERMPTDACLFLYQCSACKATLRPKPGDCCVFCSYGTVKCPPMQAA